ncbi:E2 ubiquitin-protein ligase peroxin 4 [Dimargaris cristalligena]|uniref:Ubiquitin-conjugating enzyme/RWD-like protein n=1 Tax=Dimargaris cristalligena TaxID=215637 RepID=A0A4P9ZT98_9FUNG|nr:E2 ubiquitin-protein ligase peroxin 4 [Dimargaris cristalligena]RKP36733.1 ubiquitin-conjugating enzyme/RWD-like protein [Dimargaris cristalligena]|eukprot:RKP36733.1 ubiquitin-conjugating enzyme/RWD-like protein [Dimargaris cristalligena]
MHPAHTRRLLKEIQDYHNEPSEHEGFKDLRPRDDDTITSWQVVIVGPRDTGYEGGQFQVTIEVPSGYPLQPPQFRFITPICHPNVHFHTGEICLDILKTAWSPAWTLQTVCLAIHLLLSSPEPTSPLNCDAAALLRSGDLLGYQSLVRMYTQLYAQQGVTSNYQG